METSVVIYVLAFASAFLAAQSVLGFGQGAVEKTRLNRRLRVQEKQASVADLIVELRRQRGQDREGNGRLSLRWFNDLVTRSGLPYDPVTWSMIALAVGVVTAAAVFYFTASLMLTPVTGILASTVLPVFFLKMKAAARDRQLGEQLPDALEIIVRSLEAGHPVPTAVSLVGREMPDPIGSEFGMAADEIAYGSSLEEAVKKLAERTQQPDVELFAATVRLQARTGGNLASLLKVNASTVRARQKMRLKVKAASSEGRASALILTSAPFIVMGAMHMLTPHFYGSVIDEKLVQYGLGGCLVWMAIGNLVMRKMISFKV
ncbi:pilus assembly protein TadB [Henriciella barbarensis]|uniref:Pilus assembly protein TadB n=1 Tax=Henriciella barbarensis TaxID=86342 RepID=A0A399QS18_9PROT|nr:type II secretion system F family protein [Henriciella barbarensis]RIJ21603.1 pilus assembly protein TadB [Henriciella barbarensis]